MASSDAFADELVTLAATAGGSWWLGILESRPQDAADLAAAALTDVAPIAAVEIVRASGSWTSVAGRQIHLAADVVMPASTGESSPAAWCLFDDEALTIPVLCGWLADSLTGPLASGSVLTLPAATVALAFPDRLTVLP
jgi:hypothetical protein